MAEADQDADPKNSQRVGRRATKQSISAEDALAEAQRTIKAQAGQIDSLEKTNAKTAETALSRGADASNATLARLNERETAIANGKTASINAVQVAQSLWRTAREAGNLDDEQKANDMLTSAKVDLKSWEFQEEDFKARKPQLVKEAESLAKVPIAVDNSRSERWKADHPKFKTDSKYNADAIAIHELAVAKNIPPNSDAYINFLNDKLALIHGANHGKDDDGEEDQGGGRKPRDRSLDGAPPSRDSGGALTFNGSGGNLRLSRGSDGKERLDGDIPAEWAQAAEWSGMDSVAYAISQMKILEERKRNGSDGTLEAGVYR